MLLGWTQEILGPVQPQVVKRAGERRFGWNVFLGEGCFDLESEDRGDRDNRSPGGGRELRDCCSGMRGEAEEGMNESGQFFMKFAEDDSHCAQDQRLLRPEYMTADRHSSIRGRLVAFHVLREVNCSRVL